MKASVISTLIAAAIFGGVLAHAQIKGPRSYLRPGSGGAAPNSGQPQANAAQPGTAGRPGQPAKPEKPQQPKFKELQVNSPFFFVSDTNRAFTWIKISSMTASNTKNGVVAQLSGETPVQK